MNPAGYFLPNCFTATAPSSAVSTLATTIVPSENLRPNSAEGLLLFDIVFLKLSGFLNTSIALLAMINAAAGQYLYNLKKQSIDQFDGVKCGYLTT